MGSLPQMQIKMVPKYQLLRQCVCVCVFQRSTLSVAPQEPFLWGTGSPLRPAACRLGWTGWLGTPGILLSLPTSSGYMPADHLWPFIMGWGDWTQVLRTMQQTLCWLSYLPALMLLWVFPRFSEYCLFMLHPWNHLCQPQVNLSEVLIASARL